MDVSRRVELIGKHMVEILVDQMRKGEIALLRAQQIARFYVDRIKTAGSHTEVTNSVQLMMEELPELHVVVRSDKIRMMKVSQKEASL